MTPIYQNNSVGFYSLQISSRIGTPLLRVQYLT